MQDSCVPWHVDCTYAMFQVEVISKKSASGGTVAVHRYMAAGSCMGVEVWQGPGLLGAALEQQLTSLVSAVTYINIIYNFTLTAVTYITIIV